MLTRNVLHNYMFFNGDEGLRVILLPLQGLRNETLRPAKIITFFPCRPVPFCEKVEQSRIFINH